MFASELRKNYQRIQEWIDNGMSPEASIAFTEGDCRLAAQLVEYALEANSAAIHEDWAFAFADYDEDCKGKKPEGCKCYECCKDA